MSSGTVALSQLAVPCPTIPHLVMKLPEESNLSMRLLPVGER